MQWKILLCWSSLWTHVAFFLMHPCFACDSLSSQGICFIQASNKMNYLFSHHDPGLLEEGPSLGEKEHPHVCCTLQAKRPRFLLSSMVWKKNVYLFFDVGRPQLVQSMQSRVHLNWLCKSHFFHTRFQLAKVVGMQIEELEELYSPDSHYENNDEVAYSLIRVDLILEMIHITSS
jgi:hypothetical protein